jgi:hypothetical protein
MNAPKKRPDGTWVQATSGNNDYLLVHSSTQSILSIDVFVMPESSWNSSTVDPQTLYSGSAAAQKEEYDGQYQSDHKKYPCNVCGSAGYSGESENPGDQCNNKKCYGPSKHDLSPFF